MRFARSRKVEDLACNRTAIGLRQDSIYKSGVENSLLSMEGKVVLITGATRGIGRSGAIRLAGLGARLILVGRHRGRLEEVARLSRQAGSPEVAIYVVDLSLRKEVMDLVEKLIARLEKL
jgi:NAD(P)-dependent dehydrogenase (short-subunit alcohol dehydrogenase family)